MIRQADNSCQFSNTYIFLKRVESFLKVTVLLQVFCAFSVFLCYFNVIILVTLSEPGFSYHIIFALYFFSLVITTQLDAYSRFQNYKMAKDLLHQYGFKTSLIKVFSRSKCQRDAVTQAAKSLGFENKIDDYFYNVGFRWYHILPVILVKKPKTLFSKEYWLSTLFVSNYKSKYFYW